MISSMNADLDCAPNSVEEIIPQLRQDCDPFRLNNLSQWRQEKAAEQMELLAEKQAVEFKTMQEKSFYEWKLQQKADIQEDIDYQESERVEHEASLENSLAMKGEIHRIINMISGRTATLNCHLLMIINGSLSYSNRQMDSVVSKINALSTKKEDIDKHYEKITAHQKEQLEYVEQLIPDYFSHADAVQQTVYAIEVAIADENRKLQDIECVAKEYDQLVSNADDTEREINELKAEFENELLELHDLQTVMDTFTVDLNAVVTRNGDLVINLESLSNDEQQKEQFMQNLSSLEKLIQSKTEIDELQSDQTFQREVMQQEYYLDLVNKLKAVQAESYEITNDLKALDMGIAALEKELSDKQYNIDFTLSEKKVCLETVEDIENQIQGLLESEAESQKTCQSLVDEQIVLREKIQKAEEKKALAQTAIITQQTKLTIKMNSYKHRLHNQRSKYLKASVSQQKLRSRKTYPPTTTNETYTPPSILKSSMSAKSVGSKRRLSVAFSDQELTKKDGSPQPTANKIFRPLTPYERSSKQKTIQKHSPPVEVKKDTKSKENLPLPLPVPVEKVDEDYFPSDESLDLTFNTDVSFGES